MFFNDDILQAALSADLAVGEMEMPNYVAPGWISQGKDTSRIERQCFLFDRRKVSPEIHLNYLWLILTADTLPMAGTKPFPIYPEPLAFNAHLTGWRTPKTAVNRAAFYILNWMRKNGVPWFAELKDRPLTNLQSLFDLVPPSVFLSSLRRGRISFGMVEQEVERIFVPTPLSAQQEKIFVDLHETFLNSLKQMNIDASTQEQPFLTCLPTLLDLSTPSARRAIAPEGTVSIRVSAPVAAAKTHLLTYTTARNEALDLPVSVQGTDIFINLPEMRSGDERVLRQCLEFYVWPNTGELSQRFKVLAS